MFKRKNKDTKIVVKSFNISSLIRKIMYDTGIPNPEDVAELIGLSRISSEVAEMEYEASEARIAKLSPIMSILDAHASITASIVAMSYSVAVSEEEDREAPDEEELEALNKLFNMVALSATISCLTALVELNLFKEGYEISHD